MKNQWETRKHMCVIYDRSPHNTATDQLVRERENTFIKDKSLFYTTYENWKRYLGDI
jgi:hypothetical protein